LDRCSDTEAAVEKTVEQAVEKPAEEPPDQGDGVDFKDKTYDQRRAYMKHTVKPKMAAAFQEFNAEKFAEFRCTTCHGPNPGEREFAMPNPDLPKIEWEKMKNDMPQDMEFMQKVVVPEMAALLHTEPYNPETQTGFGCGGCHPN
jgi:hypothetical protein